MKILIINSRYFPAAGPEKYLFSVSALLESHGHEVIPFSLKNSSNLPTPYSRYFAENIGGGDDLYYEQMVDSFRKKLQLVERQFYSLSVKKCLDRLIDDVRPDVAYVLHYQNRLSPSVISACAHRGVPVVVRVSDFSMLCTRNNLLRDGSICEMCIHHGLTQGIVHRCVKDSYAASAIKAVALKVHRLIGIYDDVFRFVVPSEFTIGKLNHVIRRCKLIHLPTLVKVHHNPPQVPGNYALFVGRVEEEKGLSHAIDAFASIPYPLKIVGYSHSGYGLRLAEQVKRLNLPHVEILGPKFGTELEQLYENCRFLIAPVLWYENLPNVVLEAMSYGKPILASDIGSMKEVIVANTTGILVPPGDVDELRKQAVKLFEDDDLCRSLGHNGLERVKTHYSGERHYEGLSKIFSEAVDAQKRS